MKVVRLARRNIFFILFAASLLCGIFFRTYNLSWGAPFFFHPDERNIVYGITRLSFPSQLNPEFFAYGSLPIYTTLFTGIFLNLATSLTQSTTVTINSLTFEQSIIIMRTISLILSLVLLFLIYKTTLLISNKRSALIATTFASLSTGLIQYAHFGTFEIWISFLSLLLYYILVQYIKTKRKILIILLGVVMGFLASTKVSTITLIPLAFLPLLLVNIKPIFKKRKFHFLLFEKLLLQFVIIAGIGVITLFLTSPFFWIDNTSFRSSIEYESSVATGSLPVFYTQGFTNTIPGIYQLLIVYPFILNPFMLLLFFLGIPYFAKKLFSLKTYALTILILFLIVVLASQLFLYVKWTRYYIPTLSFIYILLGIFLDKKISSSKKLFFKGIYILAIIVSFIFCFSYFKTVYINPDTRVMAAEWAREHIPQDAVVLSEMYDLGIVPFNSHLRNITLFNFYELDDILTREDELKDITGRSDYIILPSQRLLKSRLLNSSGFPLGYRFYSNLYNEKGEFKKVYQTPCDIFCQIAYFGNPLFGLEETANVFDRPAVTIYEKKAN